HWAEVFPSRTVKRGKSASVLKQGPALDAAKLGSGLADFLRRSRAMGLIVLKDGALRYEGYWHGADRGTRFTSMSLAKSVTALLVGAALAEGKIASLDDRVDSYVKELAGTAYGETPLRALLEMSSGIAFEQTSDA